MLINSRAKRALSCAHIQWNGFAFAESAPSLVPLVRARLKINQIVLEDNDILVTECGFVTMAIHADRAEEYGDVLTAPGVDDRGLRGFLVLRKGAAPYHSLSSDPENAYLESERAQQKASVLLAAFGDKKTLHSIAQGIPWYTLITNHDLAYSGLCSWGSDSFLRRFRLTYIANRFGLPKIVFRLAGSYGDRVVAASLLRVKVDKPYNTLNTRSE